MLNYNNRSNNSTIITNQYPSKKQSSSESIEENDITTSLKSPKNLNESSSNDNTILSAPEVELQKYSVNLNAKANKNDIDCLIGREAEIQRTIEILCRRKKTMLY